MPPWDGAESRGTRVSGPPKEEVTLCNSLAPFSMLLSYWLSHLGRSFVYDLTFLGLGEP